MIYFGTDGIRGIACEDVNAEVAFRCGNAIAQLTPKAKIIIGKDTRVSGDFLFSSFASGATMGGANIVFVGVAPTPAISYLTKFTGADYGVMITASHNPAQFNGIKVFDNFGYKVSPQTQISIERLFAKQKTMPALEVGRIEYKPNLLKQYINFVKNSVQSLSGLKIVIDCANGASSTTAGKIFSGLGAKVIKINSTKNGRLINKNCGALHPQKVAQIVKKNNADIGFAFDGDADRIIMIDNNGKICDGDQIILYLTNTLKKFGLLHSGAVVGTTQTNMAIDFELKKMGLQLLRTDVGDQYVASELKNRHLQIGGEQSGHIIFADYQPTGDGVFCAVQICYMLKKLGGKISDYIFNDLLPQFSLDFVTNKKYDVINSCKFKVAVSECETMLAGAGRIVARASGTESKVRIMVECKSEILAKQILDKLLATAKSI